MEAVSSPNVQITVTQPQQLALQGTATNSQNIQIFAQDVQDPNNPGKALYIIDPSQASGLQMISNADQRFEFNAQSGTNLNRTTPGQPQQSTAVVVSFSCFHFMKALLYGKLRVMADNISVELIAIE